MALSKLDANSFDLTDNYALTGTVTGAVSTQKLFLIKNLDASSSSTLSFVDGASSVDLDNTYKTYLFRFNNMHPSADQSDLQFQGSTDGGSNYNTSMTTTFSQAYHDEGGSSAAVSYDGNHDQANGTSFQTIHRYVGNGNDECSSGELWLFNPSDTTFVTHFFSTASDYTGNDNNNVIRVAGYFNTTSAINAIQFKQSSGTMDAGRIALYGIK